MRLQNFGLRVDENIEPAVIHFLRQEGFDVVESVKALQSGASDVEVLDAAYLQGRAVVTHDRDFGGLALAAKRPFVGILFLRPGHIRASFTIESLQTLLYRNLDLLPPFVIVVERSGVDVHIRVRQQIV